MTQSILLYSRQQRSRDNWKPRNVRQTALSQSKSSRNCKFFDKGDYDLRASAFAWATLLFRVVIPRANQTGNIIAMTGVNWLLLHKLLYWYSVILFLYIYWFMPICILFWILIDTCNFWEYNIMMDTSLRYLVPWHFYNFCCLWISEDHQFLSANFLLLVSYDLCSFLVVGPYARLALTTKCC